MAFSIVHCATNMRILGKPKKNLIHIDLQLHHIMCTPFDSLFHAFKKCHQTSPYPIELKGYKSSLRCYEA